MRNIEIDKGHAIRKGYNYKSFYLISIECWLFVWRNNQHNTKRTARAQRVLFEWPTLTINHCLPSFSFLPPFFRKLSGLLVTPNTC